jgi:hypothetical protein
MGASGNVSLEGALELVNAFRTNLAAEFTAASHSARRD